MEETYLTRAIVLNNRFYNEDGARITVYSLEKGKLELIARGIKKIKSKLAGHLEPLSLAIIMVVKGRLYDYAGSAVCEKYYSNIKDDYDRLAIAGQAIKKFSSIIKPGIADERIFKLLEDFLSVLDKGQAVKNDYNLSAAFFIFKLLIELGYKPELYFCVNCKNKILPGGNKFNLNKGGLICASCSAKNHDQKLTISGDGIKILRLICQYNVEELKKIKIENKLSGEVINIVGSFLDYNFS